MQWAAFDLAVAQPDNAGMEVEGKIESAFQVRRGHDPWGVRAPGRVGGPCERGLQSFGFVCIEDNLVCCSHQLEMERQEMPGLRILIVGEILKLSMCGRIDCIGQSRILERSERDDVFLKPCCRVTYASRDVHGTETVDGRQSGLRKHCRATAPFNPTLDGTAVDASKLCHCSS